jgi:hypothetical protein
MIIQALSATIYDPSGWDWHTELHVTPTWDDIEVAIRRLDQFQHPFVWLYRSGIIQEDTPYDFNVIGGNSLYAFDGMAKGKSFRYIQPNAGHELVDVWTSDQGFVTEAHYVCRELAIVLQATKYFCEHGEPDPALSWEWEDVSL